MATNSRALLRHIPIRLLAFIRTGKKDKSWEQTKTKTVYSIQRRNTAAWLLRMPQSSKMSSISPSYVSTSLSHIIYYTRTPPYERLSTSSLTFGEKTLPTECFDATRIRALVHQRQKRRGMEKKWVAINEGRRENRLAMNRRYTERPKMCTAHNAVAVHAHW